MDSPVFSLVVPTINRKEELRQLFHSLYHQSFRDFEVIIVDQNDDDRITDVVTEFASVLHITHVRQKVKGASRARNTGLSKVKGQIITFPDDDCEYPPDLLEKVLAIFRENPQFTGINVTSRDKESEGKIARLSRSKAQIDKFNILPRTIEFAIFVRASAIQNFYFDEELGVGSHTPWWSDEGPDFILRLISKGAVFMYYPELVIYHPNPVKIYNEKAFTRSYKYGCGRGRFLRKHHYPFWFVVYIWGLYVAGILIGCFQFNAGKIKYYYSGLKGRMQGYIRSA